MPTFHRTPKRLARVVALSRSTRYVVGEFFTLNVRFALGDGCDYVSYVSPRRGHRRGQTIYFHGQVAPNPNVRIWFNNERQPWKVRKRLINRSAPLIISFRREGPRVTGCIRDNSCRPARDLSEFMSKDRCSSVVEISLRSLHFLLLSSRLLQTYLRHSPLPRPQHFAFRTPNSRTLRYQLSANTSETPPSYRSS